MFTFNRTQLKVNRYFENNIWRHLLNILNDIVVGVLRFSCTRCSTNALLKIKFIQAPPICYRTCAAICYRTWTTDTLTAMLGVVANYIASQSGDPKINSHQLHSTRKSHATELSLCVAMPDESLKVYGYTHSSRLQPSIICMPQLQPRCSEVIIDLGP